MKFLQSLFLIVIQFFLMSQIQPMQEHTDYLNENTHQLGESLNLTIILDDNQEYNQLKNQNKAGALIKILHGNIQQENPILVSRSILAAIINSETSFNTLNNIKNDTEINNQKLENSFESLKKLIDPLEEEIKLTLLECKKETSSFKLITEKMKQTSLYSIKDNEKLFSSILNLIANIEQSKIIIKNNTEEISNILNCHECIKNLYNSEKWTIYTNKNINTFILLLPVQKNQKIYKESFNFNILEQVTLCEKKLPKFLVNEPTESSINELINIILPSKSVSKKIYLIGHGEYSKELIQENVFNPEDTIIFNASASIANLKKKDYESLIEHLELSGCKFCYINSCFAGGLNSFKMHQHLRKNKTFSFPIIIEGLTDQANPLNRDFNVKVFFTQLELLFDNRLKFKTNHWIVKPFESICQHIAGNKLKNTPSILFPGENQYFKTINVNNQVFPITHHTLLEHELKEKQSPLIITETQKCALIYPSVIHIPLSLTGNTKLISKIPGRAHHYFNELIIADDNLVAHFDHEITSPKLFFFKSVKTTKQTLQNVIVKIYPSINKEFYNFLIEQKINKEKALEIINTYTQIRRILNHASQFRDITQLQKDLFYCNIEEVMQEINKDPINNNDFLKYQQQFFLRHMKNCLFLFEEITEPINIQKLIEFIILHKHTMMFMDIFYQEKNQNRVTKQSYEFLNEILIKNPTISDLTILETKQEFIQTFHEFYPIPEALLEASNGIENSRQSIIFILRALGEDIQPYLQQQIDQSKNQTQQKEEKNKQEKNNN